MVESITLITYQILSDVSQAPHCHFIIFFPLRISSSKWLFVLLLHLKDYSLHSTQSAYFFYYELSHTFCLISLFENKLYHILIILSTVRIYNIFWVLTISSNFWLLIVEAPKCVIYILTYTHFYPFVISSTQFYLYLHLLPNSSTF